MALACGVSVDTFYNARNDCRFQRAKHSSRCGEKDKLESPEANYLHAYVRDLRSAMEGDKGGGSFGHWHTARESVNQRWKEYEAARRAKSLPIIGSLALFTK
eukprot:4653835-Pleurochrysis_carterae.AAC.1